MPIQDHYDKTMTVLRMSDESGDTEGYAPHLELVPCHLQPLDESFGQDLDGSFGKDSLIFCDAQDILEDDRIEIEEVGYRVVGVESFKFLGKPRHMELRVRRFHA